jgi:hypothetical protein
MSHHVIFDIVAAPQRTAKFSFDIFDKCSNVIAELIPLFLTQ